ncbi:MAG: hypothetical protein CL816_05240 [Coxiellaceae bacterium]|nr:hypothetical protein [Coxiellaceae bacterium]
MIIRSLLNLPIILTLACISLTSFANKNDSPHLDNEGYCVIDIPNDYERSYDQQKIIPVPDVKGHIIRIHEQSQKLKNTKLCNGENLVSATYYALTDYVDLTGSISGYAIFKTDKGDRIFIKATGIASKEAEGDLANNQTIGIVIGGTGSLASASGDYQYIGRHNRIKEKNITIINKLRYKIASDDNKKPVR